MFSERQCIVETRLIASLQHDIIYEIQCVSVIFKCNETRSVETRLIASLQK